ncbi:MAG: ferredoxin [Erysipelotrichaceae bacterium]|nr:ferredoxin [Erysipelotrichaceae bacterium]
MKVHVDQDKCIGCGLCTSLADAVFAFNDDGKATAGDVSPDDEEAVEGAIASCPVEAIVKD